MSRFFTADPHLGHERIIELTRRPYRSLAEMNDALIRNAEEVVGADDELWVLGDLTLGPAEEGLALAARLPGRKHLVVGNHDRMFGSQSPQRRATQIARYEDAGYTVHDALWLTTEIAGQKVVLSHFPYAGDHTANDRYLAHRPEDRGLPLLHGHVHGSWHTRGRMFNVGVDVNWFAPVPEAVVAHWIGTL